MTGFLDIRAGKGFQMVLREEPLAMEDIRMEMEHDLMWQNTIEDITAESILIQKTLPDGSQSHYHFVTVLPGRDGNVIMRSNPMGEFTKSQAELMLASAETFTYADELAQSNEL